MKLITLAVVLIADGNTIHLSPHRKYRKRRRSPAPPPRRERRQRTHLLFMLPTTRIRSCVSAPEFGTPP